MLLQSELLQVLEDALLADELEVHNVIAIRSALVGLCELELLLNTLACSVALAASECADRQLWLDFCGPGYCAVNCHNSAEIAGLEVSDFVQLRQIVNSNLEEAVALDLLAETDQELLESLTQVWLESPVLLEQVVDKVGLTELKRCQVSKIDLHSCLLVLLDLIGLLHVKLYWLS